MIADRAIVPVQRCAPRVLHFRGALAERPRAILLARPMTIAEVIAKHRIDVNRMPTIALVGEEPVLRGQWAVRQVRHDEVLSFITMPRGGGGGSSSGKQIVGLIASLALVIAAPFVGAFAASALGFAGNAAVTSLASAAFLIGGNLLLNAILPKQSTDTSSVPSVSAGSNQASPLDVIPALYGTVRYAPRFAAAPYSEYQDNDQYLYQLFALTLGECTVSKIEVGDTPMWTSGGGINDAWPETEIQICAPGEAMTLFPANVETSSEVSGQTLLDPIDGTTQWLGPYVVNAAGTTIDRIAIDMAFPGGFYKTSSSGSIKAVTVELDCQYRQVDDGGSPVGDGTWLTLYADNLSMSTRTPQRITKSIDVDAARYEVRFGRHDSSTGEGTDTVVWAGLRGYLRDFSLAEGVSYLAVKIKANDQLTSTSSTQFNVTATRKLSVYDASTGVWSAPQETRSIAWAAADICRNTDYGAALADTQFDVAWLASYDTVWANRGDTFNYVFDSKQSIEAALRSVLRAGRAQPIRLGGTLGFVRDEPKSVRRAIFTPRNMVSGSFFEKIVLFDDDSPDSVKVQYSSDLTWRSASVTCLAPGYSSDQPADLTLVGVTDYNQAWREGTYEAASNAFRRRFFGFDAEWDGRILTKGDPVLIQHPILGVNQSGAILTLDDNTLTLDRDVTLDDGDNYLMVRTKTGVEWGLVKVTAGADASTVVMDATSRSQVESEMGILDGQMPDDQSESAQFILYATTGEEFSALIVSVQPNDKDHVSVLAVIDDSRVHTADQTQTVPPIPVGNNLPVVPAMPVLDPTTLSASVQTGTRSYMVYVGYSPAVGATSYYAEISYDDGASWQPIYSGTATRWSAPVDAVAFKLRVQAIGQQPGPFATITLTAEDLPDARWTSDDIYPIDISFLARTVTDLLGQVQSAATTAAAGVRAQQAAYISSIDDFINSLGDSQSEYDKIREGASADLGNATAAYQRMVDVVATETSALATELETLSATVGDNEAAITTEKQARADGDAANASAITTVSASVANLTAGGLIKMTGTTNPSAGVYSEVDIAAFVSAGGPLATSALTLQVVSDGNGGYTTRFIGVADQFFLTTPGGTSQPFAYLNSTLYLQNVRLGTLTFDYLQSGNGKLKISGAGDLASIEVFT